MGKSIAIGIGLVIGLLLGFILGVLQPVSAQQDKCWSPPEATLLLHNEYPQLKSGPILQKEGLRAFINSLMKAGAPTPDFSFDVLYLYEDKEDGTTGLYFFHLGCYQTHVWLPSHLIQRIIKETNSG